MSAYRCACQGCAAEGFWVPALVMSTGQHKKTGGSARVELKFTFCAKHRKTASVTDFLNDEVWSQMAADFSRQGKEMPERGSIELDFLHVHHGYCN